MKRSVILPLLAMLTLAGCGQTASPSALNAPKYALSPAPQLDFSAVREEEIHTSEEGIIRIESKGGYTSEQTQVPDQANADAVSLPKESSLRKRSGRRIL